MGGNFQMCRQDWYPPIVLAALGAGWFRHHWPLGTLSPGEAV
jgi:hypothetical protein